MSKQYNHTVERIKEALSKTTPGNWTAEGDYPFYVSLKKPAASLSKHDDTRPTYWPYHDGVFVLMCRNGGVQFLLDEIERLKEIEAQYEGLCK
jgi:hypothetical protein